MTTLNPTYQRTANQRRRNRAYAHPDYKAYRTWLRINLHAGTPIQCQNNLPGCLQAATQPDHIIPIAEGGHFTTDNLQPSCQQCNARRGGQLSRRQQTQQAQRKDW